MDLNRMPLSSSDLLIRFRYQSTQGTVRHLTAAFVQFLMDLGLHDTRLLLAAAVLSEMEAHGHSCVPLDVISATSPGLLGWSDAVWHTITEGLDFPDGVDAWRELALQCEQIFVTDVQQDRQQPLVLDQGRLYLRRYWRYEMAIAAAVKQRVSSQLPVPPEKVRKWLDLLFDVSGNAGGETDWQKVACAVAVRSRFAIITGGPGTGKTYTVARLLALLSAISDAPDQLRIALAAPTGKAAARLKQSIDGALAELVFKLGDTLPLPEIARKIGPARTLHSLLGARPDTRAFRHHAGNPLDIDLLIVDEASMVHLEMMTSLLDALPANATLILLGDKDQLASVEAGAVLGDLCGEAGAGAYRPETIAYIAAASGQHLTLNDAGQGSPLAQQTVMLKHSRRFSGAIGALAQAVNRSGAGTTLACLRQKPDQELCWKEHLPPQGIAELAFAGREGASGSYQEYLSLLAQQPHSDNEMVSEAEFHAWVVAVIRAFESFRLLCAVRDGEWGVSGLNQVVEKYLDAKGLIRRRHEWYVGRPVMVMQNDYSIGVFNGDIGMTLPDRVKPEVMRVYFLDGERVRQVLTSRLRHVETAFAMTIHKSQGSEFTHAAMVLPAEVNPVMTRELVYTGITRARKYFTLVAASAAVLRYAIEHQTHRIGGLQEMLHG
ncbi:exodeoxyribonuclease V subunit alpha [Undibacterium oligocarboniphilum]|nr:exodeoxyribonuclease V subunit alpha [Undibacterium oligocarboniphilum]